MTDKDDVQPYHAPGAAPGQETADVVAEVLQHAAEREEAAKKKMAPKGPPRWMLPLTVNLGLLALYFIIAQPEWVVVNPLDDPRPISEQIAETRTGIYFDGIQRIENFRTENGRLPATLAEAGSSLADQGVSYTVVDDDYILIYQIEGQTLEFDSATDSAADFVGGFINLPG